MSSRRSSEGAPKKLPSHFGKTTTTTTTSQGTHPNDHQSHQDDNNLMVQDTINKIPHILPHERVFPVQIGGELFKLSGASLSSDAPSYFSQYFLCQIKGAEERGDDIGSAIKTLYIDRDPVTFRDIALHLQGYHITPRDGTHFVRLFADAQFYNLPRMISQLYEESIFVSIGHREFQIPRDIFLDPGNSPNFFSLGFAAFFSRPDDLFPGLDREGLLRPPSIIPPAVHNRSADTFADLLHILRGYPVKIRDEAHRQELLRDARYFHFKGLEQRLIAHSISFNQARARDEIVLRLETIQKSGISVSLSSSSTGGIADADKAVSSPISPADGGGGGGGAASSAANTNANASVKASAPRPRNGAGVGAGAGAGGFVTYARPYVDDKPAELVVEIGGESTKILFNPTGGTPRAEFFRDTRARVARLLEVVATKLNLPPTTQPLGLLMVSGSGGAGSQPATPGNTPLSEDLVRVDLEAGACITLNGRDYVYRGPPGDELPPTHVETPEQTSHNPRKRRRGPDDDGHHNAGADDEDSRDWFDEWIVRTGQWRLRIQPSQGGKAAVECVLEAVKIDAYSHERARNKARKFLGE